MKVTIEVKGAGSMRNGTGGEKRVYEDVPKLWDLVQELRKHYGKCLGWGVWDEKEVPGWRFLKLRPTVYGDIRVETNVLLVAKEES